MTPRRPHYPLAASTTVPEYLLRQDGHSCTSCVFASLRILIFAQPFDTSNLDVPTHTRPSTVDTNSKIQGISVSGSLNQICCKYVQCYGRNRNSNSVNKYHHLNMPCRHRTTITHPFVHQPRRRTLSSFPREERRCRLGRFN